MTRILYWLTAGPLLALIGKGYAALRRGMDAIPLFKVISGPAQMITDKIFGIIRLPKEVEESLEPFFEFQRGRQMDRLIVFAVLVYMVVLGAYPSPLGHLDTSPQIWVALPIVSGFNPYLGLVSGILFSVADWVGKWLPFESVYGADFGGNAQDFFGARVGYLLAYTTMILNGLLPGVLARVFRNLLRGVGRKIFPSRVGQAAVIVLLAGAAGTLVYQVMGPQGILVVSAFSMMAMGMAMQPPGYGQPPGQMPPGGGDIPLPKEEVFAQAVATLGSVVGATTGIVASHEWAQHVGNYGAFYALRANADVSCRDLSAGNYSELQSQAPIPGAIAGAVPPGAGGVITGGTGGGTTPPGGGTTPPGGGTTPSGGGTGTATTPTGGGTTTQPRTDDGGGDRQSTDGQTTDAGGNPLNQYLGDGQAGDSQSAWVENEDGTYSSTGYVYDPNAGGWREASNGERDAEGLLWDATAGQWVDERTAADYQRQRRETQEMIDRQRAENERRAREAEERRREAEERRRREEAERRRQEEAERLRAREQRRRELQERQRELEREAARLDAEATWWDRATAVVEGVKLTVDTAANVVADVAPKPAGTVFGYVYGTATGIAGGAADAAVNGGSMLGGAVAGGVEGAVTTALGNYVGNKLPGGVDVPGTRTLLTTGREAIIETGTRATIRTAVIGEGTAHVTSGAFSTASAGKPSSARIESETRTVSTLVSWLNPWG